MVKIKPPIVSRKIPERRRPVIQTHAQHIGEIMIAWNEVQSNLFMLFWALNRAANYETMHGIWHCIQSDKTQRDMVTAAAKGVLKEKGQRRMLVKIEWLIARIADLSPYRNDSAHTPIFFQIDHDGKTLLIYDFISARKPALERLELNPISKIWARVRGDIYALSRYTSSISDELLYGEDPSQPPFPRRPRLLTFPAKKKKGPPKSRLRGAARRTPRP